MRIWRREAPGLRTLDRVARTNALAENDANACSRAMTEAGQPVARANTLVFLPFESPAAEELGEMVGPADALIVAFSPQAAETIRRARHSHVICFWDEVEVTRLRAVEDSFYSSIRGWMHRPAMAALAAALRADGVELAHVLELEIAIAALPALRDLAIYTLACEAWLAPAGRIRILTSPRPSIPTVLEFLRGRFPDSVVELVPLIPKRSGTIARPHRWARLARAPALVALDVVASLLERWRRPRAAPPVLVQDHPVGRPLIDALRNHRAVRPVVLLPGSGLQRRLQLLRQGISYRQFAWLGRRGTMQDRLHIRAAWADLVARGALDSVFNAQGLPWGRAARKTLERIFIDRGSAELRSARRDLGYARRLRPRAVVTCSFVSAEQRRWIATARAVGVPSLAFQHGLAGRHWVSADRIYTDRFAVWGEQVRAEYEQLDGHNLGRCVVTGNPAYDGVCARSARPRSSQRLRPLVVHFPSDDLSWGIWQPDDEQQEHVRALCAVARRAPDVEFAIKVHPMGDPRAFRAIVRDVVNVKVVTRPNASEWLDAASAVLVFSSTVALDASVRGLPVLQLKFRRGADDLPYSACGAALLVESAEDLGRLLDEVLAGGPICESLARGREALIAAYADGLRPGATMRLVELVRQLAGV